MARIPGTDLHPSTLALGGNVFGWTADEDEAFDVLNTYAAAGGNFIDTADMYSEWADGNSGGESESIIGRWLERRGRRDDILIATKVGKKSDRKGLSRDTILKAADESLKRLGVDTIDLYYAHEDDPNTPLEETLAAFGELIAQGKVRYIGASNYSAERLQQAVDVALANALPRYCVLQPEYNLMERDYEGALSDTVIRNNLVTVPYFSLASGFLTGKYRPGEDVESQRSDSASRYLDARGKRVLEVLDELADNHGVPVATISLAWLAARPEVISPLASARTTDQLGDLLAVNHTELSDDEVQALNDASGI